MSGYRQTYDQWRADPQAFWAEAAREISWIKAPERIFDPEAGVYGRWFPDARSTPATTPSTAMWRTDAATRRRSTTTAR